MSTEQKIWLTGDSHFGHANIIKYSNRPFKNSEEMDETIIRNINDRVQSKDTLYHLGDFAFARGTDEKAQIQAYRDRINCKNIILILGNHDPHTSTDQPKPWLRDIFTEVYVRMKIKVPYKGEIQKIILDHYAGRVWNTSHYGCWQIFGHSHGSLPDDPNSLSMDVGVDCHDFCPIDIDYIGERMAKKTFKPIDHHKPKDQFDKHLDHASEVVSHWPEWKQNLLGGLS